MSLINEPVKEYKCKPQVVIIYVEYGYGKNFYSSKGS